MKIGFFDSGVGGLSVLREGLKAFPGQSLFYYGDTAHMPYGEKKPDQVRSLTLQGLQLLEEEAGGLDGLVMACNTATAYALSASREAFSFPIVGMIEAGSRQAVQATRNKKVLIAATPGTVKSGHYQACLHRLAPSLRMMAVGIPQLAPAVEGGEADSPYVRRLIRQGLAITADFDFDTLVLACTHYPLARSAFEAVLEEEGRTAQLVNPARGAVAQLAGLLGGEKGDSREGRIDFYVSGPTEAFEETALSFLKGEDLPALYFH